EAARIPQTDAECEKKLTLAQIRQQSGGLGGRGADRRYSEVARMVLPRHGSPAAITIGVSHAPDAPPALRRGPVRPWPSAGVLGTHHERHLVIDFDGTRPVQIHDSPPHARLHGGGARDG